MYLLTSQRTRIAKFAQEPTLQGPSCRKRTGNPVPRAEKFGDLMTADHKVLSEGCESGNNHRYAVVVQDLATQWIQSYPCKTKTSQETQRSLQKFLEPNRKPKVIYTNNSLEFGKACEDLFWNHCTSTPHRSETNGIAERAVRRVQERTSVVLLQSGLDEKWWAFQWNATVFCKTFKTTYRTGKLFMKGDLEALAWLQPGSGLAPTVKTTSPSSPPNLPGKEETARHSCRNRCRHRQQAAS